MQMTGMNFQTRCLVNTHFAMCIPLQNRTCGFPAYGSS
ncbi:hypothetical protein [Robinsoniella peoriensis]